MQKWDSEQQIHVRFASHIRREYPGIIFRTDFAAGIKLPIWLAKRQKAMQYKRGFPDIFIYQPAIINGVEYHGMAIELKKKDERLKKLDGTWASDHIAEQFGMLTELKAQGYFVTFAVGYDEATAVLEHYLTGVDNVDWLPDFIPKIMYGDVQSDESIF